MKTGKYINLGQYKNIKIGYGTVDYKELKTIYIKLNTWLEAADLQVDEFDKIIQRTRRTIKNTIYNLSTPYFKQTGIVDLDIKTKGIRPSKRSFMDLDITLYVDKPFDVKSKDLRETVKRLIETIVEENLTDKNLFNFHETKK
jgi:hypothetical protein